MEACDAYLKEKHIKYLREWLEACIEWIVEENQTKPPDNQLVSLVYEQWLMADLEEIAEPCLPSNFCQRKGYSSLEGRFSLQISYFLDIGHSAFSQLLKINGSDVVDVPNDDNEDEEELKEFFSKGVKGNSNAKRNNPTWKTKQSRMVFFELTDGTTKIEAIEYQPLNGIKIEDISPGGKVLLSGKMNCFDGILLLKAENIKYLGGNCESLIENKTQEKILSNILNVEPKTNANSVDQRSRPTTSSNAEATRNTVQSHSRTNLQHLSNIVPEDVIPDDIFDEANNDFFGNDDFDVDENNTTHLDRKRLKKKLPILNNRQSLHQTAQSTIEPDLFNDSFDDFEIESKTPIGSKQTRKPPSKSEDRHPSSVSYDENFVEFHENTDNLPVAVITLEELVHYDEPIQYLFSVKAWFKTLASKLQYENEFHLLAVISDGTKTFIKVLLSNELLTKLIGFSANEVKDAARGVIPEVRKQFIKKAISNAEISLKNFSGKMHITFDSENNIYKIIDLEPE